MNKLVVFIIALIITYHTNAQEIKEHYDENMMVSRVDFYSNGELKNTISLENPFNITSYDSIAKGGGTIRYHISSDDLSKLGDVFFQELTLKSQAIKSNSINTLVYINNVKVLDQNFVLVRQSIAAFGGNGPEVATSSEGKLYNSDGISVLEFNRSNKWISDIRITENKKFLICKKYSYASTGGLYPGKRISYDIYNLENNSMIYSHIPEKSIRSFPPTTDHNYFIVINQLEKDLYEFLVLKPESQESFSKNLTRKELYTLKRYNVDGVVFITNSKNEQVVKYSNSFVHKKWR
jgi:hypothetical protein